MSYLLTVENNYVHLDNTETGERFSALKSKVEITSSSSDATIFYFNGLLPIGKNVGIDFTDIDVNGAGAFATLAEWKAWYTDNTGFNGGGTAPTNQVRPYVLFKVNGQDETGLDTLKLTDETGFNAEFYTTLVPGVFGLTGNLGTPIISFSCNKPNNGMVWNAEDFQFETRDLSTNTLSDTSFEDGGWIKIEWIV